MGDSAEVEKQAVGGRNGGSGSPAAGGEEGEAVEEVRIGGGIVVANVEAGDEGAGLGDRHSGMEAEGARFRRGGGDEQAVAGAAGEEEDLPPHRRWGGGPGGAWWRGLLLLRPAGAGAPWLSFGQEQGSLPSPSLRERRGPPRSGGR